MKRLMSKIIKNLIERYIEEEGIHDRKYGRLGHATMSL